MRLNAAAAAALMLVAAAAPAQAEERRLALPGFDRIRLSGPVTATVASGRGTSIRGRIGLIRKGTGLVVGEAVLAGSLPPLDVEGLLATQSRHRIDPETLAALGGRWNVPWVLEGAAPWKTPVPYVHPRGAVTWVMLRETACPMLENQIT